MTRKKTVQRYKGCKLTMFKGLKLTEFKGEKAKKMVHII